MSPTRLALAVAAAVSAAGPAAGQVAYPPPPDRYDVQIHYRIRAGRDERIRQFQEMTRFFDGLGFAPADRDDADLDVFDPAAEHTRGTVPSSAAALLLNDPRVRVVVASPPGLALDDPKKAVDVRGDLTAGLAADAQKRLHDQTVGRLRALGFEESVGYDHRGFTRVRGRLPAGNLPALTRDLRYQPAGWFLPPQPLPLLPLPFRGVIPLRFVEVLGEAADPPPARPADPAAPKVADDLTAALADPAARGPVRAEVVFDVEPLGGLQDAERGLRAAAPGAVVDGLVGAVASVRVPRPDDALRLAGLPEVVAVRRPRAGTAAARPVAPTAAVPAAGLLAAGRVAELHRLGYRGKGVKVAVVAAGFPQAEDAVGRQLPPGTRVLDLTAELDPDLRPAPETDAGGTAAAAAAAAAAPDAQFTLVRVDPRAFHQLLTVARAAAGDRGYSAAVVARVTDLTRQANELIARREAVLAEYRRAFASLSDDPGPAARRQAARDAYDRLVADERAYRDRAARLVALRQGLDNLAGTGVVINTLVWESGYPQDGLDPVSQYLDLAYVPRPTRSAIRAAAGPPVPSWVQAGSPAVGRVWAGPVADRDDNRAVEFAPPDVPLPAGRWTRELNFLRLAPAGGPPTDVLPAGLTVRLVCQWREPHDPDAFAAPDPALPLGLRLLRQVDPTGRKRASDEFVEVARTTGPAVPLMRTPSSGVYEATLTAAIPADGVYAVRLERLPTPETPLPVRSFAADVRPRLVVEPADESSAQKGEVAFATFAPPDAGVGMPAAAGAALTVGVGAGPDFRRPVSLTGAGPGAALRVKPDLLTAGAIAVGDLAAEGPGASAGFVGGAAASGLSAGVRARDLLRTVGVPVGGPLVLPYEWLNRVAPYRVLRTER